MTDNSLFVHLVVKELHFLLGFSRLHCSEYVKMSFFSLTDNLSGRSDVWLGIKCHVNGPDLCFSVGRSTQLLFSSESD